QLAGEAVHRLDRLLRGGGGVPWVASQACAVFQGLDFFLRGPFLRHHLTAVAGLDLGRCRAKAACGAAALGTWPAPRRARPARAARAGVGRLSRAVEKPVFPPRPDPILVEADARDPLSADPDAVGGRSGCTG